MSLTESDFYPAGSTNDPLAPWNEEEAPYNDVEASIEELDGQELYESANHDVDADMDVFEVGEFRLYDSARRWDELSSGEQALWDSYAEVRRGFAYLLLKG